MGRTSSEWILGQLYSIAGLYSGQNSSYLAPSWSQCLSEEALRVAEQSDDEVWSNVEERSQIHGDFDRCGSRSEQQKHKRFPGSLCPGSCTSAPVPFTMPLLGLKARSVEKIRLRCLNSKCSLPLADCHGVRHVLCVATQRTHTYIHTCIHPSIHPSIHACMHACMRTTYIHTYIHTRIQTRIQTYKQLSHTQVFHTYVSPSRVSFLPFPFRLHLSFVTFWKSWHVGLSGPLIYFSIHWEFHLPNWRTHIFQRGRYSTNQINIPGSGWFYWIPGEIVFHIPFISSSYPIHIPLICINHQYTIEIP